MGTGKFKNGVYHAADGLVVAVELVIERIDLVHAGGGAGPLGVPGSKKPNRGRLGFG